MQQLRDYQRRSKQAVEHAWNAGSRSVLLVLPTGSGKTTVLAHILSEFGGRRMLFLCPWRQLVHQAVDRFRKHGLKAGPMMGRLKPAAEDTIHVATIQTASRRTLGEYAVVAIDEAHRAVSRTCLHILRRYPKSKMIGLTATPRRYDGKALSKAFDRMIVGATVREMIDAGYFAPFRCYGPREPIDTTPVKVSWRTKDYETRGLEKIYLKPKLVGDVVQAWLEFGKWRPTFVYAVSVRHANHLVKRFNASHVPSAVILGDTSDSRRLELFEALRSGNLKTLVTVGVLTEGIDFPELGCVVMARPTLSPTLYRQMVGRGSRVVPGKSECIVIDHAGNIERHGFPDDEPQWTLRGKENDNSKARKSAPKAVQCPICQIWHVPNLPTCPNCGWTYLPAVKEGKLYPLKHSSFRRYGLFFD